MENDWIDSMNSEVVFIIFEILNVYYDFLLLDIVCLILLLIFIISLFFEERKEVIVNLIYDKYILIIEDKLFNYL